MWKELRLYTEFVALSEDYLVWLFAFLGTSLLSLFFPSRFVFTTPPLTKLSYSLTKGAAYLWQFPYAKYD